jgi:hypothetical protein
LIISFNVKIKITILNIKSADYGSLSKNRTIYTFDTITLAYMWPPYVLTAVPPRNSEALFHKIMDHLRAERIIDIFRKYVPSTILNKAEPVDNLLDYFSKIDKYEHAKFADRFAIAISIYRICKYSEIDIEHSSKIKNLLLELLNYNNTKYFENKLESIEEEEPEMLHSIGGNKNKQNKVVSIDKNNKLRLKLDGNSYVIKNDKNRYYVMKGGNKIACTKEVNKFNKK